MSQNPDFIIIGAAKAGTTAIWNWLNSHPQVFMPSVKEPSFFSFKNRDVIPRNGPFDPSYSKLITTNYSDYCDLFQPDEGQICGEASPIYLQTSDAAQCIYQHNPSIKLIAILRDPAKRAFSQFSHNLREGYETTHSFLKALELENKRREKGWLKFFDYLEGGRYGKQLETFYEFFDRDQILVLEFENLKSDPETEFGKICEFLNIKKTCDISLTKKFNVASSLKEVPRFQALKRMSNQPNFLKTFIKKLLPKAIRIFVKIKIEQMNLKNTKQITFDEKKLIHEELSDDLALLRKITGMNSITWEK
jgi:hypothetical protein